MAYHYKGNLSSFYIRFLSARSGHKKSYTASILRRLVARDQLIGLDDLANHPTLSFSDADRIEVSIENYLRGFGEDNLVEGSIAQTLKNFVESEASLYNRRQCTIPYWLAYAKAFDIIADWDKRPYPTVIRRAIQDCFKGAR